MNLKLQKSKSNNLFALLFVVSAITGYVTIELRLHQEYQDYRDSLYLECNHCGSLERSISSGRYNYVKWSSDDFCYISPPPAWSGLALFQLNKSFVYNANTNCKHRWSIPLINDRPAREKGTIYFMPLKLLQVQKIASCFFYILCLSILVCFIHLFVLKNYIGILIFKIFWSLMSFFVVLFSIVFPVGVPLTTFLREYRVLSRHLAESSSPMGTRAEYLLSDEAIIEIAKTPIEIVPSSFNKRTYCSSSEIRTLTFPNMYFKRAQARLAIAVAQYDAELAGRFFYGADFTVDNNLTNLTARLARRLIKVDNESFVMEKPYIRKTIIRGEGIVDVLWAGDRSPRDLFLTTYKLYHLNNKGIWIPIWNISNGGYRSIVLEGETDNVTIW